AFVCMVRPPPSSPLFPYTTLFRSLAKAHFAALGRSLLERGLVWWASEERLRRLIRVDNEDVIRRLKDAGRPIILLAPHFVGLDRSEEHTSELQSRENLVCRLLLEK